MGQRLQLHEMFKQLTENVYFDPPSGHKMVYPAIVYERDGRANQFADNAPYATKKRYQVTIIDKDADSDIVEKVAAFPLCTFIRYFATEGLHHDNYSLYF